MKTSARDRGHWGALFGIVLSGLVGAGCGPALVQVGADVAAGGMKSGTSSVASGGSPSAGAAAGVAVGVGVMALGYKLTEPDRRQVPTPNPAPYMFNATQKPPRY